MNIVEHELGHVAFLIQIADEVKVWLAGGVYHVASKPTGFEIAGPEGLMRELMAGAAMECAAAGRVVRSYREMMDQAQFAEYDIEQIGDLQDMGMVHRDTLDRLAIEMSKTMLQIRQEHPEGLENLRRGIRAVRENGDEQYFKSATVH
jgi:hypothetical protein